MPLKNTPNRYGTVAKFFHWTIVLLIITQYILITYAEELPRGMEKLKVITYHKSFGITVLALAVLRLLWRWFNREPELPRHMNTLEVAAARISHYALYVLIFAMPLSGWIMSNAQNFPVSYFGWFTLPPLVTPDRGFGELMEDTHEILFNVTFCVALVHAAAALKHHFWDKDDVLRRMLPFARTSGDPDRRI